MERSKWPHFRYDGLPTAASCGRTHELLNPIRVAFCGAQSNKTRIPPALPGRQRNFENAGGILPLSGLLWRSLLFGNHASVLVVFAFHRLRSRPFMGPATKSLNLGRRIHTKHEVFSMDRSELPALNDRNRRQQYQQRQQFQRSLR